MIEGPLGIISLLYHKSDNYFVTLSAMEAGNPLGNLYPNHTRHWWPLVEDIVRAEDVKGLRRRSFDTLEQDREFAVHRWDLEIAHDSAGTSRLPRIITDPQRR